MALIDPSKKMFKEKEDVKKKQQNDFLSQGIDQGKTKGELSNMEEAKNRDFNNILGG